MRNTADLLLTIVLYFCVKMCVCGGGEMEMGGAFSSKTKYFIIMEPWLLTGMGGTESTSLFMMAYTGRYLTVLYGFSNSLLAVTK